ncbi:MAG: lysophospholipid acyltransferase family protein [Chitinophagaceae bacterium]
MKFTIKLLKAIYSIYALLLFIFWMFVALPFVLLALLFGTISGGNIIYKICKIWAFCWYCCIGIWHKNVYEVAHDISRQYIFVANHISYMDIPPIVLTMNQPYRVLGKYEMVKYPVFGWIYKAAVILVDRSNAEQRAKSVRALKAALAKGISIFIFPEGTFNETNEVLKPFFDGAFRLAIENQTPIKPLLFIDTTRRMHYSSLFNLTPGPNRVVYLATIEVTGLTMNDVATLKQQVFDAMAAGLRKYANAS